MNIKNKKKYKNNIYDKGDYLCFYDSEFNAYDSKFKLSYPQEVVSFGVCVTDNKNNIIDKYYTLIKLKAAKSITRRCTLLTGLTNKDMKKAISFDEACFNLQTFINKYNINIIYCFGSEDKNEFIKTAKLYKNYKKNITFADKFRDIRIDFTEWTNGKLNQQGLLFLKQVCEISGEIMHNALLDAIDLSKVAYVIYKKGYNKKLYEELIIEREEASYYKRSRNIDESQSLKAPQEILKARNKIIEYLQKVEVPNMNNGVKKAIIDDLDLLFV